MIMDDGIVIFTDVGSVSHEEVGSGGGRDLGDDVFIIADQPSPDYSFESAAYGGSHLTFTAGPADGF